MQPGAKSSEAAPIAAQAGGQQQVTAKIDDSLQNELISLRREVGDVLREMQQNQRGLVDSYNSNNRGSFQELTGPIQRVTQDLNSIEQSLKVLFFFFKKIILSPPFFILSIHNSSFPERSW